MVAVRRRFALAVLLAVLVVATAAAGLDGAGTGGESDLSASPASGVGVGSDSGIGSGNDSGVGLSSSDGPGGSILPAFILEHAIGFVVLLSITIPVVYAAVLVWQDGFGRLLDLLGFATKRLFMLAAVFLGLIVLLLVLASLFGDSGGGGAFGSSPTSGSVFGGSDGGRSVSLTSLPVPFLVVGGLAAIIALVVFSDRKGSTSSIAAALAGGAASTQHVVTETADNAVGGRTAFEDVPPTNDVYRAWLSLARTVGATDRVETPSEVAALAVEHGLDGEAVATLTDLFREIRYGSTTVTADHERRARDAVERLGGLDAPGSVDWEL